MNAAGKMLLLAAFAAVLLQAGAAKPVYHDVTVVKNASMAAGSSDNAIVEFNYHGDQSGRIKDPFIAVVNITGQETAVWEDDFALNGTLSAAGETYHLQCVNRPKQVDTGWMIGEFYRGNTPDLPNGTFYCFPEDEFFVLRTLSDRTATMNITFRPHVALQPDRFTVDYSFMTTIGVPAVDPLKRTDTDGELRVPALGLNISSEPDTRFAITAYRSVFFMNSAPSGYHPAAYLEIAPSTAVGGTIRLAYDTERFTATDTRPVLYRCELDGYTCRWTPVAEQNAADGVLTAEVDRFGILGVFAVPDSTDGSTDTDSSESGSAGNTRIWTVREAPPKDVEHETDNDIGGTNRQETDQDSPEDDAPAENADKESDRDLQPDSGEREGQTEADVLTDETADRNTGGTVTGLVSAMPTEHTAAVLLLGFIIGIAGYRYRGELGEYSRRITP